MTTPAGFELGADGPAMLVVGVDGSDTSWRALYYAFGLARRQHTTVLAVFARTTAPVTVGDDGTIFGALEQASFESAAELRAAIQALAADYGVPAEFICRAGDAVHALTEIAAERHADALVIGASQARLHHLLGSKAIRAVRRCRCPVTVVP
jgi:nucleotide-binding universal stress UspA family protein